jgi:hypothetical protein
VTHRRRFVFDKRSRSAVIEDYLEMDGLHDVEVFFHFAEDTKLSPIAGGMRADREGRSVKLLWPDGVGGQATVLEGSTTPIGGWVSRRFDVKHPAPTLVWRARLAGDCILRTRIDCPA